MLVGFTIYCPLNLIMTVRRHAVSWDEKSQHKIAQMLSMDLPAELAVAVEANAVEQITALQQIAAALLIRKVAGCVRQN